MDLRNNTQRIRKLDNLFNNILHERQSLGPQNGCLFLEAVCAQPDPAGCMNRLVVAKPGIPSLQASMRFDLSVTFLNGHASEVLIYFQAPQLPTIGGGTFLQSIITAIVEPPIFWSAFCKAFEAGELTENGKLAFAWLLLQLISLPLDKAIPYRDVAEDSSVLNLILAASRPETKAIGQKIKDILSTFNAAVPVDSEYSPGGRHDNDFVDFRNISILPTADEVTCTQWPFLRPSSALDDPETEDQRVAIYLDNQFRLLREDMIHEMREELQIALGNKKGKHRSLVIDGLVLLGMHCGTDKRRTPWGLTFECRPDLPLFKNKDKAKDRKAILIDNRKVLKHQSLACLIVDGEVVAFPTINRDEDLLVEKPPVIILQLEGEASIVKTLLKLKNANWIKLIQIDTALFSYEPVLKALQETTIMPLAPEFLSWKEDSIMRSPSSQPTRIVEAIRMNIGQDLRPLLDIQSSKPVVLDKSQAASLLSSLTQKVSLIQGPPGTGKSFIGALLAKILHDSTQHIILVVCYTNHALDQFLEDLIGVGIPQASMVRLGSKSTPQTAPMALHSQQSTYRRDKADWGEINGLKSASETFADLLDAGFDRYKSSSVHDDELMDHLEFEDPSYFEAFQVPQSANGMTQVGRRGRAVGRYYLLDQWIRGWDAGIFKSHPHVQAASEIWRMPFRLRQTRIAHWKSELLREQVTNLYDIAKQYRDSQNKLDRKFNQNTTAILKSKRIIGCTTTAAAKYSDAIQAASPGVLLVEEAGEILESHVLTAMGAETQQVILIGDHKQLRPKVNHYRLTVERGDGYDLNVSLFERLVLKGYPHQTLSEQHRMRPEISALIRHLTYPNLIDAATTKGRPNIRGIQDTIVFIDHDHSEDNVPHLVDRRDMSSPSSKQNTHEAEMVLKIVRYLAQQGYGSDKIVILTPYLAQLSKLRTMLSKDNDPILNDLDSYDLVRAGLLPAATAKLSKKPIRLATIDNYQGEESPIVIVTLTRSNADHDIGFMFAPERLNVLLSRARDALIMIGNSQTFLNARKGKELWNQLFDLLKHGKHVYDGLPVKCERHPDRKALLARPTDFDDQTPDGGCQEPCGTMLNCKLHPCPSKCHQLYDHSKMRCEYAMEDKCPQGHRQAWRCHQNRPVVCMKCERVQKLAEDKRQQDLALQQKRDAEDLAHARRIANLDEQIARETQALRDAQLAEERANAIRQKEEDLGSIAALAAGASSLLHKARNMFPIGPSSSTPDAASPQTNSTVPPPAPKTIEPSESQPKAAAKAEKRPSSKPLQPTSKSPTEQEWERQKAMEGASNSAIDSIMGMTGLEDVKSQVLRIKSKIDVAKRQNISLKDERFNVVLLGNPGTGKTTIARHYAKFLTSVQVLPGIEFIETTGSRLANDGVAGIKAQIEQVINSGGGTIFVDEAYQLADQHNFQGAQVLDFLLAEMENNETDGEILRAQSGFGESGTYNLQFTDYTDSELLLMLERMIGKKYQRRMEVEDGFQGLYCRIAVRRLGRGRGREGFGNARALENMLAKISERQAERLNSERKNGLRPDDFLLVKEDLIGPDPSKALKECAAWKKLESLTGLKAVKESVRTLFALIGTNYQRELLEMEPAQMSLNRVFLGSPGTGKTTVAKLYGRILADLGLLSNGEVVIKNPADFIGSALGQSESQTKGILATTVGKVLIIDEAYMLYGGGGTGNQNDIYKTAVIDTIVAEVQSTPGEDRCVLLLGYKDQISEMFQNVNPGLSRRFAIEDAFPFEDFTDADLLEILDLKLKDQDLEATDAAKKVAIEVLSRARNRPNFGNAGEVENLLGQAKSRYQTRQASLPAHEKSVAFVFEPQDFDAEFDRADRASTNLEKLFEDVVGSEDIVAKFKEYQQTARVTKARGLDVRPEICWSWVFKGPPGTGKTTTARKMGQVYYDMGLLSSSQVIECSASDLVGQYVGQTGPKTTKLLEKALGRVLFIDEAYRLAEGHFAKEAIDELVSLLTQPKFLHKIVVILAGYDQDMNQLLAVNTGLSSRFSEEVIFKNMTPEQCLEVLKKVLAKKNIRFSVLDDPLSDAYAELVLLLQDLSGLPSWGNARDMGTLAKQMNSRVLRGLSDDAASSGELTLTAEDAVDCMRSMLAERRERQINVKAEGLSRPVEAMRQQQTQTQDTPPPPQPTIRTAQTTKTAARGRGRGAKAAGPSRSNMGRDAGVTDVTWNQLQADKQALEAETRRVKEAKRLLEQEIHRAKIREEAARVAALKLAEDLARAKDAAEKAELKRKQEEARLKEIAAREERERKAAALKAKQEEEARKRQQEAQAQAKLRSMGVCSG